MSGTVDSATASIAFTQLTSSSYQFSLSLTNTGTAPIQTFWFAWDDFPDVNFMTAVPTSITTPSGWVGFVTHNAVGPADGYGIQFYTFLSGSALTGGHTLTGFSFHSSETPAQMFAPSPFEPAFNTLSSFVYPGWPPTIGDPNGANLVVACFAAGTRILTDAGEVAVENLTDGARIVTHGGGLAPLRWLGHRRIECRNHPRPHAVQPVRVQRDAFAPGAPLRDLLLSPDHAVFLDGVLIPIHRLVNGTTIQREAVDVITYWHVELPEHAVIFADGLAAESYLDTGNRAAFANGGTVAMAQADFAWGRWEARGCAPVVLGGPALHTIRRRLLDRAAALGHATGQDPQLRVLVHGVPAAMERDGDTYRVILPAGARTARLCSRSAIPAEVFADSDDHRRLGIGISGLRLDSRPAEANCGAGWHAPEATWRWTDGAAYLACAGARLLEFTTAARLPYPAAAHALPFPRAARLG